MATFLSEAKDALKELMRTRKNRREDEAKRLSYEILSGGNLNYPIIEDLVKMAVSQQPGFYCQVQLRDGTKIIMGVKRQILESLNPQSESQVW